MRRPNVELTCTHDVCHVLYSAPPEGVGLLRGHTCPTCQVGVRELREIVIAQMPRPLPRRSVGPPPPTNSSGSGAHGFA
jgi:hypothetical protein